MSDDFFEELNDLTPEAGENADRDHTSDIEAGLNKLASLVDGLNRDLSTSTILDRAMNAAIELTGAERGFLVLVSSNGEWVFRVARNMETGDIEDAEAAASHTVIRKVLEGKEPILINDVVGASDLTKQQSIASMQVRSIMGAPLLSKGKLLGAAYVDTSRLAGVFDETSLILFQTFVQLAAVALENARLIEAEQEATAQYRVLKDYLDTILISQPHGVVILDGELKVEYANPQASHLLGGVRLDRGTHFAEGGTNSDESLLKILTNLQEFITAGRAARSTLNIGEQTLAYSFFNVRQQSGGSRVGLLFEDITTQKQLEKKLVESEKRSTVNQLAGGIAHEINNCLQPVKGRVELLGIRLKKADAKIEGGVVHDLETITNLTDRIEKIARNLRHLTKPAKPDFRPLNLDNLLRSTVDLLASTTGKLRGFETDNPEARFQIAFDIDKNLPYVKGDQHALESAIINMILNAAAAIQEKGSGTLTISAHQTDNGVTLTIEDTGVGISPEALPRVFEPYFTTHSDSGGTGLGMSILQNVADVHGAKLDLQSEHGKGTRITMTFPTVQKSVSA